jgi:hypothetical protein
MSDDWRRTEDDVSRDIARLVKVLTRKKKPVTRIPTAGGTGGGGGGMTNPMTTAGDIIVGGTGGTPQRLGIGSNGQILAVSSGAPAWQDIPVGLTVILDGGGQAIQTTQPKPLVRVPFAGTVTAWYVNADQSGSIVVDVQRAAAGTPTSFSSIAGTEKPSLSSQQSNSDTSLTTWTTALNAGDWLRFVVESASTVQLVAVALHLTRTV